MNNDIYVTPFTIVVDSNEQAPYQFRNLRTRKAQGCKKIAVKTIRKPMWNKKGADYSIEGMENKIQIERKSLQDLYSTLGQRRERFEWEIESINKCDFALVVIEASWQQIENGCVQSQLNPASVVATINSWEQRYRNVRWHAMSTRRIAEEKVFRTLERYWKEHETTDGNQP